MPGETLWGHIFLIYVVNNLEGTCVKLNEISYNCDRAPKSQKFLDCCLASEEKNDVAAAWFLVVVGDVVDTIGSNAKPMNPMDMIMQFIFRYSLRFDDFGVFFPMFFVGSFSVIDV